MNSESVAAADGQPATVNPLSCAQFIAAAFADYNTDFRAITRRAPQRFEERDWHGSQKDVVERIELYDHWVNATVAQRRLLLGERALDRQLWRETRAHFADVVQPLPDTEFNKTFFSSITRRLFGTVGVAADIEPETPKMGPLVVETAEKAAGILSKKRAV